MVHNRCPLFLHNLPLDTLTWRDVRYIYALAFIVPLNSRNGLGNRTNNGTGHGIGGDPIISAEAVVSYCAGGTRDSDGGLIAEADLTSVPDAFKCVSNCGVNLAKWTYVLNIHAVSKSPSSTIESLPSSMCT